MNFLAHIRDREAKIIGSGGGVIQITDCLSGKLTNEGVNELEQHWRRTCCAGSVHEDVYDVKRIDDSGKALLSRMFFEGVELVVRAHAHS
jgi:hypothetical protein